jgi:cobalt-zinc-cadmium efflux system outer membrane protein
MMHPALILTCLLAAEVSAAISAHPALSLPAALERALGTHPQIAVLAADVEAARGARADAAALPNPELEAGPGVKHTHPDGTVFHGEASISQTLEFPGKRALRASLADGDIRLRTLAQDAFRAQLRVEVRRAFYRAVAAQRIASLRSEQVQSAQTFLQAARKRVAAGYASDFETAKAQADWIAARKDWAEASGDVRAAKLELSGWMGAPGDTAFDVAGELDSTAFPIRTGDPVAMALAANAGLRGQVLQAELARKRTDAAKLAYKPDLTVTPSVEYAPDEQVYGLNFSLPLPVWNRGRGAVAAAAAEERRAGAETEKLRQEIASAVRAAQEKVRLAEEQKDLYAPAFLSDLKNIVDRAEKVYGQNATSLLIYLEARRSYYETLTDYYLALGRWVDSHLDLEAAIGAADDSKTGNGEK